MLDRMDILTIFAFTLRSAYSSLGEAFTVLGLTLRLGALATHLPLDLGLIRVKGEQVVNLALG